MCHNMVPAIFVVFQDHFFSSQFEDNVIASSPMDCSLQHMMCAHPLFPQFQLLPLHNHNAIYAHNSQTMKLSTSLKSGNHWLFNSINEDKLKSHKLSKTSIKLSISQTFMVLKMADYFPKF